MADVIVNWTPATVSDPEPGFVMADAEGRLRALLPDAKRLCARQYRSAIWDALLAAEALLGELDARADVLRAYVARIDVITRAETAVAPGVPEEAGL